jgi:hypothetical protein
VQPHLFHIPMEYVIKEMSLQVKSTIFHISVNTTNRICIRHKYHWKNETSYFWGIWRTERDSKTSRAQRQCRKHKSKDTKQENNKKNKWNIDNDHDIEVVTSLNYLGTAVSNTNDETEEIKAGILAANKAY